MMRSLRARLLAGMIVSAAVLLAGFGGLVYALVRHSLYAEFDSALVTTAHALAASAEWDDDEFEIDLHAERVPEFQRADRPAYFQFFSDRGAVLMRSPSLGKKDLSALRGTIDSPAFADQILPDSRPGRAVGIRFVPGEGQEPGERRKRAATQPVVLVVARDTVDLHARLRQLLWALLGAGAGVLATALLISAAVVRRGLRPLDSLARRIGAVHEDDLGGRVPTERLPTELLPVGEKLNDLLGRLQNAFQRERRFTADVAHELRTPLAGVRSTLEVAMSRQRRAEEYHGALGECLNIAKRMEAMVTNLLTLARLDARQVAFRQERIRLSELLDSCWRGFSDEARSRNVAYRSTVPADLACTSDRQNLAMVLTNLLANAAEYADEDGRIEVTGGEAGGKVELEIANTSCRLTKEQVTHVFDRFWRGDESRTGEGGHCGLGLSLVGRIVNALGGTATADLSDGLFSVRVALPEQMPQEA